MKNGKENFVQPIEHQCIFSAEGQKGIDPNKTSTWS